MQWAINLVPTQLSTRLSIQFPLIVAPMAGGPTTPELVAASCNAGALGSLGCAYFSPEQIRSAVDATRAMTSGPFAINLFTPMPNIELQDDQIQAAIKSIRVYREELGLPEPKVAPPFHPDFEKQFEIVLQTKPSVFSFVFGLLNRSYLQECRKNGILTMGTATTLDEGLALEASGVDVVVAQGVEAGGHRGLFDSDAEDPCIGTLALTQALISKLKMPVVAAGGIMDGKGIASALALGAQAVQMGTAFLLCDEAGTSKPYRDALSKAGHKVTRLTRSFSGRWARGIENRYMNEMEGKQCILPFPAQNAFTRDIRIQSTQLGSPDFLSLWAGSGVDLIRSAISAHSLIKTLQAETSEAMEGPL